VASLTPGYYSLDDITCSIGPTAGAPQVNLSGYGDDGGINIEPQEDIHSVAVGADGLEVFSESNNSLMVATITLKAQSLALKRLVTLMQAQKDAPGLPLCPFALVDPHSGDSAATAYAVGKALPNLEKGAEAADRSAELFLSEARDAIGIATSVTPV